MNEYCCPLCSGINNIEFYQLQFRKKGFLPDKISFMYCDSCNFVFTVPRDEKLYMQYYANCKNDQLSKELNAEHCRIQKKIIASHTDLTRGISILDFGCGCGGLLSSLRTDYTANTYIGFDPNPEQLPGITCYQDMAQITGKKFDLIICSHILEHAVNPYFLDFSLLLNENGSVYVEFLILFCINTDKEENTYTILIAFILITFRKKVYVNCLADMDCRVCIMEMLVSPTKMESHILQPI